jgi:hypothetical protein
LPSTIKFGSTQKKKLKALGISPPPIAQGYSCQNYKGVIKYKRKELVLCRWSQWFLDWISPYFRWDLSLHTS